MEWWPSFEVFASGCWGVGEGMYQIGVGTYLEAEKLQYVWRSGCGSVRQGWWESGVKGGSEWRTMEAADKGADREAADSGGIPALGKSEEGAEETEGGSPPSLPPILSQSWLQADPTGMGLAHGTHNASRGEALSM